MKKRLLSFIILLLILLSCNSNKYEKNKLGINGKVKKVTKITYLIKKDSTGKLSNDTLSVIITYLNDKGNLRSSKSKFYIGNVLNQITESKFIYNSKDQLVKELANSLDSTKFEIHYEYKDNLLFKTISKDTIGRNRIDYKELYIYDSNRKLKQRDYYNFLIDLKKNDTTVNYKAIFKYDKNEYLVEANWTYLNSIHKRIVYLRDSLGLLEKQLNYNKNGVLIDSLNFKYKFDKKNNWIKKMEFKNDSLIEIVNRIIE